MASKLAEKSGSLISIGSFLAAEVTGGGDSAKLHVTKASRTIRTDEILIEIISAKGCCSLKVHDERGSLPRLLLAIAREFHRAADQRQVRRSSARRGDYPVRECSGEKEGASLSR